VRGDQRGFTLLEVLAAIVLLALAFAALLGTLGRSTRLAVDADAHTRAALCAQSALDGAFVLTPVAPGMRQGRCDARFRWRLEVRRWKPPGPDPAPPDLDLYQLDLTVSWGRVPHVHRAEFRTLRAQMRSGDGMGQGG